MTRLNSNIFESKLTEEEYEKAYEIFSGLFETDKWKDDFETVWRNRLDSSIGLFVGAAAAFGSSNRCSNTEGGGMTNNKSSSSNAAEGSSGSDSKSTKLLIGFSLFERKPNGVVYLEYLAIASEYQNLRLGSFLLEKSLQLYPTLSLVPLNDDKIINWYKKHGFKETSRGKHKWGEEYFILST
jgi:ribosomal protein S18 acetylase RimI-like enzyme